MDILLQHDLRRKLKDVRIHAPDEWDASRHLVGPRALPATLVKLRKAITDRISDGVLCHELLQALPPAETSDLQEWSSDPLKALTGLPTTKALRALCIHFGLLQRLNTEQAGSATIDDATLARLTTAPNPFDLLIDREHPAVLDLGAGDLSFIESLAAQYVPLLRAHERVLTAHAIDRVQPGSALATAYQAPPDRLRRLRAMAGLSFYHSHDADMFGLAASPRPRAFLPRYDLVTCWAPANPTFAYEPTRLTEAVIRHDLERTRGHYRLTRVDGEAALEVRHQGRSLLFPPWKFDVRGPLALLDLMSRLSTVAIVGAVDDAVFWELLSQLIADPGTRPRNLILRDDVRRTAFGTVYDELTALSIGGRLRLETRTLLRHDLPRVLPVPRGTRATFGLRSVDIRRGAAFPGMPVSQTASRYANMSEEAPPWFLLIVFTVPHLA